MAQGSNRKKFHHFVHDGYLKAWRTLNTIYVYDLDERRSFEKTGRDVSGEGKYNVFSFDETVLNLLHYTFAERTDRGERSDEVYRLMLYFIDFMKDFDYQHKTDNFLEDFYGQFETRIGEAIKLAIDGKKLISDDNLENFHTLFFSFASSCSVRRKFVICCRAKWLRFTIQAITWKKNKRTSTSRCTYSSLGWRWPLTS